MLNSFKLIDEHQLATILMQLWGTGLYANRYSQPTADIQTLICVGRKDT